LVFLQGDGVWTLGFGVLREGGDEFGRGEDGGEVVSIETEVGWFLVRLDPAGSPVCHWEEGRRGI